MGESRTPEQVRSRHVEALGEELGPVYHYLWQELTWLYKKWLHFKELFGTKESRVELLNAAAPATFSHIQDVLWEDMLLHLARLVDRDTTAGKPNMTVRRLPGLVGDITLKEELTQLIQIAANDKASFATDWRNRRLAHRDMEHALRPDGSPLQGVSRRRLAEAMEALANALNAVELHYFGKTVRYDLGTYYEDAAGLLRLLHDGLELERARIARRRNGTAGPEDFLPPPDI